MAFFGVPCPEQLSTLKSQSEISAFNGKDEEEVSSTCLIPSLPAASTPLSLEEHGKLGF